MGLKAYLVKRAAQTVVTIIVVLALMFVLFRLMPGSPERLALVPGQTPQQMDVQRVAFGFARWEDAPGVFKQGSFTAADSGLYSIEVDVIDDADNAITLYAAYVNQEIFFAGSPIIILRTTAEPSINVLIGTTVTLSTQVVTADPIDLAGLPAWALVTSPGGSTTNVTLTFSDNLYSGSLEPTEVGTYSVEVGVYNPTTGDEASAPFGFAANPLASDIAPFSYVEDEDPRGAVFTERSSFNPSIALATVIVQSTEGGIGSLTGAVMAPDGSGTSVVLSHPVIAVRVPVYEEFWNYITGMLTGNFGTSFFSGRPVISEISEKIGPTLLLFGLATILALVIGIGAGVLLAWYRGSRGEIGAIIGSLFFYSMPIFWFGLILLFVFALNFSFFPIGGFGCVDLETGVPLRGFACASDVMYHLALPLITLVVVSLAGYILLMRNSLLEVLGEDYIIVARAKGLSERKVMYKHAARNALLPVTTVVALAMAGVISGGVLTETIFSWPGMGFYLVTRTLIQDFPAVQAAFFILALLTILANVVADVAYAYLDPRVRL